jgi:hypothetical protein
MSGEKWAQDTFSFRPLIPLLLFFFDAHNGPAKFRGVGLGTFPPDRSMLANPFLPTKWILHLQKVL